MANKYTTPGAILIKSMLPTPAAKAAFDPHTTLDKDGVAGLISILMKHGGPNSHDTIGNLSTLFFNKATEMGASTPLSDYDNNSDERHALIAEFEEKVRQIMSNKSLSDKDKSIKLSELSGSMRGLLEKQNIDHLVSRGSTAAKMALTGARGNKSQLQQGTSTPLMAEDVSGNPIPVAIRHSFAEGLSPAEHIAMSYGGRAATVKTQLSTALPGTLFKQLTPNVFHEVVTVEDCKTKNGIKVPVRDKKRCFGHFEAGTNRFIDEQVYKELFHSTKDSVTVRSTLTCEAKEGICQKCYGLAANGRLPDIGENLGVIAAQSASETLTQAVLSTKHKGGVAGGGAGPYELASNLLNNPQKNFLDEATISQLDGVVTEIKTTALNDHEVYINAVRHFVPKPQVPTVKMGEHVYAGDRLSTGTLNPRKLAEIKGVGEARSYLSHALRQVYGTKMDPRHFDLIARNMIKYVEVKHPGDTSLLPGQKITVSDLSKHLDKHEKQVGLGQAVGQMLSRPIFELVAGTKIAPSHVDMLARRNIDKLWVTDSGLVITPIVPGLKTGKLLDKNWISSLSLSHLKKVIQTAGAEGLESEIHSTDPITALVMGSEFGMGQNGKY